MKSRIAPLIVLFTIMFSSHSVNASHILGHEIFYTIDANGNAEIGVILYRDCGGIAAPEHAIITAVSSCGDSLTFTADSIGIPGNDVWQFLPFDKYEMVWDCPNWCNESVVASRPGVQRFVYAVSTQLPQCSDWRFSQEFCCINPDVNNLIAPGANESRVSAYAFLTPNQANSSPLFIASTQFVCTGSGEPILQSAYDVDGDSLVYSFCPLYIGWLASDTVLFFSGANSSQPFINQTVVLDPNDGIISTPINSQSQTMIGIQVEEYRNGILVGRTQRASYVKSFACQTTGSINTTVLQGNVVNGELQPTVGSEVIIEYTASVSDPQNYYLYCTTCEHLEDYTWTTTVDVPNGMVTATLNWTAVAHELEVPLHVRLLQETCAGNQSSSTMLFTVQYGTVTDIDEFLGSAVSVYPNPSNQFFTMEAEEEIIGYELMDLSGRRLIDKTLVASSRMVDLELKQPDGTYLLRVFTRDGISLHKIVLTQ